MKKNDPDLLIKKYGRAFQSINIVEELLENILLYNGGLINVEEKLRNKLLNQSLGRNIELTKSLIHDSQLKSELISLNKRRKFLAHRNLAEVHSKNNETGEEKKHLVLIKHKDRKEIDIDFFDQIVKDEEKITKKLVSIIKESDLYINSPDEK